MDDTHIGQVGLEPWGEADFWLLRRINAPEMTEHLGGPETEEQLAARQQRYVRMSQPRSRPGQVYRVVLAGAGGTDGPDGAGGGPGPGADTTVGSIGFWEREWQGAKVWETGWSVLPEFQGRGLAARAALAVAERARAAALHRYLHAFPGDDHPASNAVCRRAGFTLLGPVRFEYPKGHWMTSNDWRLDLGADLPDIPA